MISRSRAPLLGVLAVALSAAYPARTHAGRGGTELLQERRINAPVLPQFGWELDAMVSTEDFTHGDVLLSGYSQLDIGTVGIGLRAAERLCQR